MAKVTNISGEDRDVPLLGRTVAADETVEVADELVDPEVYAWPDSTWKLEGPSASDGPTVEALRKQLKDRGLPTSGTKPELLERLAAANDAAGDADDADAGAPVGEVV